MPERSERNGYKYDGLYAVCTDLLDDDVADILKVSEGRWQIEDCFRTMKTDFDARPVYVSREDRIKLDTGRRSALFVRNGNEVELKGVFGKIKISEEISENLPLLSYLGITYKKNGVISDVIEWFEDSIDFLNYGNPRQELRTAIAKTEEVKKLVLDMIREMDLDIEDFRIEEKEAVWIIAFYCQKSGFWNNISN